MSISPTLEQLVDLYGKLSIRKLKNLRKEFKKYARNSITNVKKLMQVINKVIRHKQEDNLNKLEAKGMLKRGNYVEPKLIKKRGLLKELVGKVKDVMGTKTQAPMRISSRNNGGE